MTEETKPPTKVLDEIKKLEKDLPDRNPEDAEGIRSASTCLREIGSRLRSEGLAEHAQAVALAIKVLGHVEKEGCVPGKQAMTLVEEIVRDLAQACDPEARKRAFAAAKTGIHEKSSLQLLTKRKLGEVLVSLAMMKPEEIEFALKNQRSTGKRFGETLVTMGILTPAALQSVLGLQRRLNNPQQGRHNQG